MKINVDNLNINYILKGSGDYVFLLHGWGSNQSLFNALSNVIAEKYTVVSLDLPGHGESEEPTDVWDVSVYANFLINFIQQFKCEKVTLLGHSFGGRVIIKIANIPNLPFTIDKIILVSSAGILPKRTLKFKVNLKIYKIAKGILKVGIVNKMFPNALNSYQQKRGSIDYNNASGIMKSILIKTINEDLAPLLKNIKVPTLLIWGDIDTITPLSDGQLMEKTIPDAGLVVLKGAGHFSFLEQASAFHRVIKSFLKIGE